MPIDAGIVRVTVSGIGGFSQIVRSLEVGTVLRQSTRVPATILHAHLFDSHKVYYGIYLSTIKYLGQIPLNSR